MKIYNCIRVHKSRVQIEIVKNYNEIKQILVLFLLVVLIFLDFEQTLPPSINKLLYVPFLKVQSTPGFTAYIPAGNLDVASGPLFFFFFYQHELEVVVPISFSYLYDLVPKGKKV
jgi:hypothetical protein